ncbi:MULTISPECIES: pseudouridine synthase [Planococcus]|uniref:Pseudouridine synthase n=2 Tax=Planococcus TaxID=1372 RepID=A0ABM5WT80_9BACL|nr:MULTISPECIES: pseudouridine synthase [Planococcus]ALS77541.1 23S rRNA pseudouridine synthase F [Planococcus kocurii]AQU80574.1 23S rRNA pseudouridine synthase F [Planococcus faecalis]MDJ0330131.1 pseudouridine synthase [Planococcus sp. S3-L1]OHX54063.1 23S rRNA pseudouridine synthase F [Planococcus faecalis]
MRINKFLSETGITSRRGADKFIEAERVTINGKLAELGSQVESNDEVRVDGKIIEQPKQQYVYLALNKPIGITSTTERHIDGNIVDFVNHPERIFHIGRLDKDSEGLILLTNDGDIVNEILRVENEHEKQYIVKVDMPITESFLAKMEEGVEILDTKTLPAKAEKLSSYTFKLTLRQGLNRQIRRMCTALGYEVRSLQRVRIINIFLEDLPVGEWRDLTDAERNELFNQLGYTPKR